MSNINHLDIFDIELYENDIEFYLNEFCEKYNIEDLKKESPNTFNACLTYIHRKYIRDNIIFKDTPNMYNRYKLERLVDILDVYIYICNIYTKEISINGFSKFTGINRDTIERWGADPSCECFDIWKKLIEENEQSNSDLLTVVKNPTGPLARLNHNHNWNMPNVTKEVVHREKMTLEDTMKDFERFKIEQNCQTIDDN